MGVIKVAFFVEGYTEQVFVKKLLIEIFSQKQVAVEVKNIRGGSKVKLSHITIETPVVTESTSYYVLIYNCGSDSTIKSYILDQRNSLIKAGYIKIIGLRDVYPIPRAELHKLVMGLNCRLPQREIPILFILSVMELESWFLAEENHYLKINHSLTPIHIQSNFGFDPTTHNTELIDEPAITLKSIYNSVGKDYDKLKDTIDNTIDSLDYSNIYFNVHGRNSSLKTLIDEINLTFI